MKKLFSLCLAALIAMTALGPLTALATEDASATETTAPQRSPDSCGENLTWRYEDGVLTVSGSGAMDDFAGGAPWDEYRSSITTVVFSGGVTYVGAYAFRDCDSLVAIDFGGAMHTIGERAFQSCEGLTAIYLPASFRRFSAECFEGCKNLMEVWCSGGMPSFNFNCLWNYSSITVYCPTANPWPESAVEELETNFGGRLQVLAADGEDPYDFGTDETEETKATEPTAPPTTEPATEPETQPVTQPETEPEETPATEPTDAETEQTGETEETEEAATQPVTEPEQPSEEPTVPTETQPGKEDRLAGKSWIGIVIVAGVLTILVGGALIVRSSSRGGKYSA